MNNSERLLREAVEEKRKELEELESLALFTTRKPLSRTPPGGFGSVEELRQGAEKRPLQSPEEVQEALRRKLEPTTSGPKNKDGMSMKDQDIEDLIELANTAGSTIMSAATGPKNKLNKADLGLIGTQVQRLTAVVATLAGRLLKAKETERTVPIAAGVTPPGNTYASMLRTGRMATQSKPQKMGASIAVYPVENSGLSTADQTKTALKEATNPHTMGLQVARLRKVGNAGVVLQTRSKEDLEKIKKAMPASLKVQETGQRTPLVAILNIQGHVKDGEELLGALRQQNFSEVDAKEGFPKHTNSRFKLKMNTQMMTRRATIKELEEENTFLLRERSECEEEMLVMNNKIASLKTELSEIHIQKLDHLDQRDRLQETITYSNNCNDTFQQSVSHH
ncbi:unnamed protein product [Leptidea sinapis]|uniref:Uncharacterized protein n=1 Tax=Leptidea sinapis TaxID=189913 RepID=A0A5E4PY68_9NEOP|nr:unnamed protein product [Leptidea sinapis]